MEARVRSGREVSAEMVAFWMTGGIILEVINGDSPFKR